MADLFWFSDEQWAPVEALLPQDTRGVSRVDDLWVLSGIVNELKCGGRWGDCREHCYVPKKTLNSRIRRRTERGVLERIFAHLDTRNNHGVVAATGPSARMAESGAI